MVGSATASARKSESIFDPLTSGSENARRRSKRERPLRVQMDARRFSVRIDTVAPVQLNETRLLQADDLEVFMLELVGNR